MSIYKPCDIRGHVADQLTTDLYRSWGCRLAEQVPARAKFIVGGDVRLSTPRFQEALIEGLCLGGAEVVDLGHLPTPMVYYAKHRLQGDACAIVTASHNEAQTNGLKWMIGDKPPRAEQVEILKHGADLPAATPEGRGPGSRRKLDISFDYVAWLQETWIEGRVADFRVVLDPMFGCWASRARRYLQAVFPRVVFSAVHDTPDPLFNHTVPDCSLAANLQELSRTVEHERADLGIAFDGDGDRVALLDSAGIVLSSEEATEILLGSLGEALRGEPFVFDQKFSHCIPDLAERLGATPVLERSGHAFLRGRMIETGAPFGAEISGHYFFRALDGGDDGLFTACWLLDYLAHSGKSLSDLRGQCPRVYMTPDLRVPVAAADVDGVLETIRSTWSDHPQSHYDGVRVTLPNGWVLARRSVTEPVMTFRFEADDAGALRSIVWDFCDHLDAVGDGLWAQFEKHVGGCGAVS